MLIDVHTHVTPPRFPANADPAAAVRWPCMHCTSPGKATLLIGETPFRQLDARSWDAERRLADMVEAGIAMQVLSPMPELLSYWLPVAAAELVCDTINAHIAGIVARHPRHFRGLGAVPLQDPARAAALLPGLRARFGLSGVEIGSNINGMALGDPALEPFYAAAEREGLAIFVHALHPVAKTAAMPAGYAAVVLFPVEIAMAAASILLAGVLERYPRLRIGLSHGAGALPAMLGRLDQGWLRSDGLGSGLTTLPSVTARSLFMDSNVYDARQLAWLADRVAPARVFAGSDYPYRIMESDLAGLIGRTRLGARHRAEISHRAALRFLGEPPVPIADAA